MLGTLETTPDGRFVLRFTRDLPAPPAVVWPALATADPLVDHGASRLDLAEGARLLFVAKDRHLLPDQHGVVIRCEPPHRLEHTRAEQVLSWRLTPVAPAATRLDLAVTTGFRAGATAAAPLWHAALDALHASLGGPAHDPADADALDRAYRAAFG